MGSGGGGDGGFGGGACLCAKSACFSSGGSSCICWKFWTCVCVGFTEETPCLSSDGSSCALVESWDIWEYSPCPSWGGSIDEGMFWYVLVWYVDMMKGALLIRARLGYHTELGRSWLRGYLTREGTLMPLSIAETSGPRRSLFCSVIHQQATIPPRPRGHTNAGCVVLPLEHLPSVVVKYQPVPI